MEKNRPQVGIEDEQAPWWRVSIASSEEFQRRQHRRGDTMAALMGCAVVVAALAALALAGGQKIFYEWLNVLIVPSLGLCHCGRCQGFVVAR